MFTASAISRQPAKNGNLIFSHYITENSFSRSEVLSKSKNFVIFGEKLPTNEYEMSRSWHPRRERNLRVNS